jgi:hypothetical protein
VRLALRKVTTRSAAKVHLRKGGVTREVVRAWQRKGGVTKQFYSSLSSGGSDPGISVSPTFVSGARSSSGSVLVTSRSAAVTVVGGVAPYGYTWAQASGDPMAATAPTADESAFEAMVASGALAAGTWTCTVTDAAGKTGSVDVDVSLRNLGGTL